VSVPDTDEAYAVPRLAESIIHEAMHLQLTLIESIVPLINSTTQTAFSPWKQSERPVQGLLHALYVFAVISEALNSLVDLVPGIADHAARRCLQIAEEVAVMGDGRGALTDAGVALWDRLTRRVNESASRA
jgi:HEXXH motif-containing protein